MAADEMPPCPLDDGGKFVKPVTDYEGMHIKVSQHTIVWLYRPYSRDFHAGSRQGDHETLEGQGTTRRSIHHQSLLSVLLAVCTFTTVEMSRSNFVFRSGTPLVYRAIPSWFVRVEPIKDQLVANNKETLW